MSIFITIFLYSLWAVVGVIVFAYCYKWIENASLYSWKVILLTFLCGPIAWLMIILIIIGSHHAKKVQKKILEGCDYKQFKTESRKPDPRHFH